MALEDSVISVSLNSAAQINQYRFVSVTGSRAVTQTAAAAQAHGVSLNKTQLIDGSHVGQAITVAISGIAKVECSATIAAGAIVASAANGQAVTGIATNKALGVAITGGAVNELIEVLLLGAYTI